MMRALLGSDRLLLGTWRSPYLARSRPISPGVTSYAATLTLSLRSWLRGSAGWNRANLVLHLAVEGRVGVVGSAADSSQDLNGID